MQGVNSDLNGSLSRNRYKDCTVEAARRYASMASRSCTALGLPRTGPHGGSTRTLHE